LAAAFAEAVRGSGDAHMARAPYRHSWRVETQHIDSPTVTLAATYAEIDANASEDCAASRHDVDFRRKESGAGPLTDIPPGLYCTFPRLRVWRNW
jgi:hypothetical protein